MSQETAAQRKAWTRPEVVRLGKIRDVAGLKGGLVVNGLQTLRT